MGELNDAKTLAKLFPTKFPIKEESMLQTKAIKVPRENVKMNM